ncbi:MAG: hypothetical protein M1828_000785 [Chrysothrix sp. TS-e1954]|nr:MAG: hypothetical protein M1828_000785 [Chrysothrix sp. TS-e1954]
MGEFMFNESFHMMTSKEMHPAIIQQKNALGLLGIFTESIWVVRLAFELVPFYGLVKQWLEMVAFCDSQMDKRIKAGSNEPDIAKWFIDEYQKQDSKMRLQDRRDVLSGNTITAMVAGRYGSQFFGLAPVALTKQANGIANSDTTRPSLIAVLYVLASYPDDAAKVFEEIHTVDINDPGQLATLKHMSGLINEAMRLYPAAMTGGSRITPPEGLQVDETWIPGGVKVAAPKYSIFRLPTAFVQPSNMIPERWYSRPDLILDKTAFAPFGAGMKSLKRKYTSP